MLAPSVSAPYSQSASRQTFARRPRRVPYRVPCRLRVIDPPPVSGFSVVGQTENVSARGLAVRLGVELSEGVGVEVLLPLHGEPTCLYGRVAHSRRVTSGTFELGVRIEAQLGIC